MDRRTITAQGSLPDLSLLGRSPASEAMTPVPDYFEVWKLVGYDDTGFVGLSTALHPADLPVGGWILQGATYEQVERVVVAVDLIEAKAVTQNSAAKHHFESRETFLADPLTT